MEKKNKLRSFRHDGERHFIRCKDDTDFEVKKALLIRDIDEGKLKLTKNTTVREWSEEFVETYIKGYVSDPVLKDHEYRLNKFILPEIGQMRLCDVMPIHCQKVMKRLEGFSADRAKKVRATLRKMFAKAKENRLIIDLPTKKTELPVVEPDGTHRPITPYERKITLKVAEYHRGGAWVLTMLYSGIRTQETAALIGKNIDLKNRVLHVTRALNKNGEIGKTKGKKGNRKIPISASLEEVFKNMKLKPFDYVFKNSDGNRLSHKNIYDLWNNFKREMQITAGCKVYRNELIAPFPIADDLVPYCYRHTFCTDLQDAGVPLNVAKDLMGHDDVRTTSKFYTTLTKTSFDTARDAIDAFHGKGKGKLRKVIRRKLKN